MPTTTPSFTTLLDLQTALTALQFGNDRPGYGSSGLPYIQTQIPGELTSPGLFKPIFRPGSTGNLDYPIRGGGINVQVGQESFTLSSEIDSIRIRKFFEDAPRGTAFINKQIGLQLTNPKIETGNVLFGLAQSDPIPGLLENTRVYNQGRNTLAQIRVSGTGGHALRHGLVPFAAYQKHYYAMVNEQNVNNAKGSNRLVNLAGLKMTTSVSPFVNPENVVDINLVNTLGISLNRNILFQYLGGPGSTYGIGSTSIKRVVDTTKLRSSTAMNYDQLMAQKTNNITDGRATTNIQDFRDQLPALAGTYTPWGNKTIDERFFVKSPNGTSKVDKLNKSFPFLFANNQAPWEVESEKENTDDLIKFVFEAISNDNTSFSTAIFFRALLNSGITDNHAAQWNSFKYLGRGENFYTYQGFDRSISFSFKMYAGSESELIPMYNRLNALVSQVYPDYSQNGIMRAPIVRVTIGDYLYRMPGFLESVNITVDNNYTWEINQQGLDSLAQLPQIIDVAVQFKPILSELPRRASLTSNLVSRLVNAESETTIETYGIEQAIPQLIANNKNVIKDFEVSQNSINRRSTSKELEEEQIRLKEEELQKRRILNLTAPISVPNRVSGLTIPGTTPGS